MSVENTAASVEVVAGAARIIDLKKFQKHDRDGGSTEIQIAALTQQIESLVVHLRKHPQDVHSQRGMQGKINRRKKLLAYLNKADLPSYKNVIASLGIRK